MFMFFCTPRLFYAPQTVGFLPCGYIREVPEVYGVNLSLYSCGKGFSFPSTAGNQWCRHEKCSLNE